MRDITLEDTVDFKFTTTEPDTGAPATLSGSPVISAYVGNSTTQLTAGITLTVDFDGVTGLNNVRVAATAANGYTTATDVSLIITTGTVDAISAVGYKVAEFTIGRGASLSLRPTTAGRTLDVSATGEADANVVQFGGSAGTFASGIPAVNSTQISGDSTAADNLETAFDDTAGAVPWMGIIDQGTAQSASATGVVLRAAAAFADSTLIGSTIAVFGSTQGYWQQRLITANALSGDAVTVATWDVTPSGTITYKIFGTAAGSGGSGLDAAGVRAAVGLANANLDTQLADIPTVAEMNARTLVSAGYASPTNITAGTITTVTNLTNAPSAGDFTATMKTSIGTAVAASAVASVTGSVGGNVTGSVGSVATNGISAASLAADAGTEIAAAVLTAATSTPIAANMEQINTVPVTGNGSGSPFAV